MSHRLTMQDLTLKFTSSHVNPLDDKVDDTETTIWQTPEGSLYRVIERRVEFSVSTLVPSGWIRLLHLRKTSDKIATPDEAMSLWLRIQNLPEPKAEA
ncbi:hypothetical protein [Streptomyces sp. NPDC088141]|uniref:hypothetical protein n=1 Tax=unclassified Streptomyces TaxID=2593676 RepID=UPI00342675F5